MDALNGYRDNHVSSDDDSEDSDKECTVWKRATTIKRMDEDKTLQNFQTEELSQIPANTGRKKNTIWTEVLQDQLISEDLEDCLLKNKPAHYESRGKESYDYTLKYSDPRIERDADCPMDEEEHCESKRNLLPSHHNSKIKNHIKLDSAEHTAARKIIKILNEKKVYLIYRIVQTVGIEKAMDLLSMTEQIEESGGMMIKNHARRRTPGGVYIQLLKSDKDVTQEMMDIIFEGEMNCSELKKYYAEKKKNKKKYFQKRKKPKQSKENTESKKMESDDMIPMDAQGTSDVTKLASPEKSILENNPVSVPALPKKSSENSSDLEEGEIED